MVARALRRYRLLLPLLLLAPAAASDPITDLMRKQDDRLSKRITILAPRIYVAEVLERLSLASGVPLSAGERDGTGDVQVCAFLRDVPLADAMNALWSLVSYRGAVWHWSRSGEPDHYEYRLMRSPAAQGLGARLQEEAQRVIESNSAVLLKALDMSPEERRKYLMQIAASQYGSDKPVPGLLKSERMWNGLRAFSASLSEQQRLSVLRGESMVTIPTNQLSEEGRAFVHSVWEQDASHATSILPSGAVVPVPEPASVTFFTHRHNRVTTSMYIELGGIGAYAYLGGVPLENGFGKKIADMWMLPGDATEDPALALPISEPKPPQTEAKRGSILEQRMTELSTLTPVSLLARLPLDQQEDPGSPVKMTVRKFIERLDDMPPNLQSKWRDKILLLGFPAWFWEEPKYIPWTFVKQLRRDQAAGSGFLPLVDVFAAADQFDPDQIRRLAEEFPVIGGANALRDLFRLCHRSPLAAKAILSEDGLPITDDVLAALKSDSYIKRYFDRHSPTAVRIVTKDVHEGERVARQLILQLLNADIGWKPVVGFRDAGKQ